MTERRFIYTIKNGTMIIIDKEDNVVIRDKYRACDYLNKLNDENKQLKAQLYCNDEEGVCNSCKYHYLIEDDETELGYYNSRCKKEHYECARVSLKHCEDFEKSDPE